jgi:hypothetical protein
MTVQATLPTVVYLFRIPRNSYCRPTVKNDLFLCCRRTARFQEIGLEVAIFGSVDLFLLLVSSSRKRSPLVCSERCCTAPRVESYGAFRREPDPLSPEECGCLS